MPSLPLYLLVKQRNRRQQAWQRSFRRRAGQIGFGLGGLLALLLVGLVFSAVWGYANLTKNLPSVDGLAALFDPQQGSLLQPTRIYDRSGQTVLLSLDNPGIPRLYRPIDPANPEAISPQLVQVVVAELDPGFWKHAGFSGPDLTLDEPYTLPERLVRSLLLGGEAPGARRALRMRLLAAQVVARYGRAQVLEWYLNSAYFGHLAYGVESAAQLYFGKSATQLDLAESALLAGVLEAPALNPLDSQTAARENQQAVLDRLAISGVISVQSAEEAVAEPLHFNTVLNVENAVAPAFTRLVVEQLSNLLGRERVERGGLRVITTLDISQQNELLCAARTQLSRLEGKDAGYKLPNGQDCQAARLLPAIVLGDTALPAETQVSAVLLDPTRGEVLALLGDTTLKVESSRISSRSPGSSLAPYLAVAAFTRGFGPASLVWDIPASLPQDAAGQRNPDDTFHGPVRLRTAFANDYLVPQAQLLEQIGPQTVWRLAEQLGITGLATAPNTASLLFEGGEVSLLESAQALGTLANRGVRVGQANSSSGVIEPVLILKVEDADGRTLLQAGQPQTQVVLSESVAYLVNQVFSDEIARWSSLGHPNSLEIGRPAAAKIGWTNGDGLWTIGYTPQRVAVVWLGLPEKDETVSLQGAMAAGLWYALMQNAQRGLPVEEWSRPAGVSELTVCDPSGLLPTAACPLTVTELFLDGTEPVTTDSLYQTFQINRETGRLATVFTPPEQIVAHTYLVVPPEALSWAQTNGIQQPPQDYDAIQTEAVRPDVNFTSPSLFGYVSGEVTLRGTAAGENFASYSLQVGQGINPQSWQQISAGTQAVQAGILGNWDTRAVSDGLYALRLVVVRRDQQLATAVLQVTVDNTPPEVSIPYPAAGQTVQPRGGQVTLQAKAADAAGLAKVEWWLDGRLIGSRSELPYSLPWAAVPGSHQLVVKAYDLAGNMSESAPLQFSVQR